MTSSIFFRKLVCSPTHRNWKGRSNRSVQIALLTAIASRALGQNEAVHVNEFEVLRAPFGTARAEAVLIAAIIRRVLDTYLQATAPLMLSLHDSYHDRQPLKKQQ